MAKEDKTRKNGKPAPGAPEVTVTSSGDVKITVNVGASAGGADALATVYDPTTIENRIYDMWEQGGYFHAEADGPGEAYSIAMPPPNVTAMLHLGHALNNCLQDILARWRRMEGRKVLWLPGTDHAGIATQAVVERRIFEQEHKNRHDLGRDELVRRIWAWREECGDTILKQLRHIGSSCDWQRTRFTLDEVCARAVRQVFFKMFSDGLIYRGKRLVNWDTHLQTAVSDDEVYHETVKGHMWHIKYPVKGEAGRFMIVATTRPETMLGDTAVAVHPDDPRYKDLIGRTILLPLTGREIPVIADGILVDPKFGSGCVKVTPAHDPNDYEAGLRNKLEMINILTPDGKINAAGGPYKGLDRFAARKKVVADLEALGLLEKVEPYQTEVGHSDRSKTPIEPYLSEQWFINMGDTDGRPGLAQLAMDAVEDGRVRFHPERYARTYIDWLSQKRDWCISRQLWWGHQIPVWKSDARKVLEFLPTPIEEGGDSGSLIIRRINGVEVAIQFRLEEDTQMCYICVPDGHQEVENFLESQGCVRDGDVLDTWFSSALWPFSTLGWPQNTADLRTFYPTDVLVTAREIITLWVARMVMMGLYNQPRVSELPAREQVPFADVYIHAMIQDGDGRPMKKSLGNGVDPLDIIATHGTDALRFTLAWMTTETQDVRLPVVKDAATGRNTSPKFDMGRNFCNKLWNAMRFALMNLAGVEAAKFDPAAMRLEDRWILSRLEHVRRTVTDELGAFHFQASLTALYDFFWHDLCDWYLETIKLRMADPAARAVPQRVLALVLDRTLRLLHPYVPFITEAAWEGLNRTIRDRSIPGLASAPPSEKLINAAWPEAAPGLVDEQCEQEFALRQELIEGVRKAKAESGQSASEVAVYIPEPGDRRGLIESTLREFAALALVTESHVGEPPPAGRVCASAYLASYGTSVYVPMPEEMIRRERDRICKEIEAKRKLLASIEGKLANKQFTDRAPPEVVEREKSRAEEARVAIVALDKRLGELK